MVMVMVVCFFSAGRRIKVIPASDASTLYTHSANSSRPEKLASVSVVRSVGAGDHADAFSPLLTSVFFFFIQSHRRLYM
jgi:hypothetical protein